MSLQALEKGQRQTSWRTEGRTEAELLNQKELKKKAKKEGCHALAGSRQRRGSRTSWAPKGNAEHILNQKVKRGGCHELQALEKGEAERPGRREGELSQNILNQKKFIYSALKVYDTDVEGADFHNAPEEVRRIINLWAKVQTHGKIKDLFPKDSFDCLAQLLQVNALYFSGKWQVKFDKELTVEAPFYPHYAAKNDSQTVQLMNRKGVYNTAIFDIGDTEVQVLEIPYNDNELSLVVLLPTDCSPEALEQLEDSLTHEHLLDWSSHLKPAEVDVFIPKFNSERSIYLNEYLDLHDLSDPEKADFSQATATEGVTLTQLVHDVFFEINEEGGEEVEAPQPRNRRPRQEALKFVADHPFLYFVYHNCTQSFVVFGKFAEPE
ncbi:leukocyte elastase inhibitor-like [Sceloporus undulatus]|uniref:leukocyte elastase inhibitor-like n=1 Tax=Sceloporus undulatus TaxID=8520 RepID=UPI001C4C30E8|nr:leukocyte elastase inhibitor-like [Sceloporus undulatus]